MVGSIIKSFKCEIIVHYKMLARHLGQSREEDFEESPPTSPPVSVFKKHAFCSIAYVVLSVKARKVFLRLSQVRMDKLHGSIIDRLIYQSKGKYELNYDKPCVSRLDMSLKASAEIPTVRGLLVGLM